MPIVGLPDPLVMAQPAVAGNFYVADEGLGWADGGTTVVHWIRRYSDPGQPFTLRRIDIQSKAAVTAEPQFPFASELATSYDGNAAVFTGTTVGYDKAAMYVAVARGYEPIEVDSVPSFIQPLGNVAINASYRWSPDSRMVAYAVGGGSVRVREVPSGVGLSVISDAHFPLSFSPDGGKLLVAHVESNSLGLEAVGLSDQSRTLVGRVSIPRSARYGRVWILAQWDEAGVKVVHEVSTPEGRSQVAVYGDGTSTVLVEDAGFRLAALSPDGTTAALWYGESHSTGLFSSYVQDNLYLLDLTTGELRLVANQFGSYTGGSVAFGPTGRRLVFAYGQNNLALYVLGY